MELHMPPSWVLAVIVSILVSFCTVIGFAMQAYALRKAAQEAKEGLKAKWYKFGELVLSPLWVFGAVIHTSGNFVGDIIAYSLAPMSLTAPLSGVSVVLNTSLAPILLGEKLHHWPDLPATFIILIGTVLTTSMGAHRDVDVASAGLVAELALRPEALVLMSGMLGTIAASTMIQMLDSANTEREAAENFDAPRVCKVILPAWAAAGTATFTNLAMKAFSELLKTSAQATIPCLVCCVVPCALVQIQLINRGLRLYPQTVFLPIYSSLLVLANSFFGSLIFEEYTSMTQCKIALFAFGVCSVMVGISLYSQRSSSESNILKGSKDAGALKESLLERDACG